MKKDNIIRRSNKVVVTWDYWDVEGQIYLFNNFLLVDQTLFLRRVFSTQIEITVDSSFSFRILDLEGGKTVNDTPSQQTKRHDSLVWVQWAHFSRLGWANVEIMGSSLNISYLGPIVFIYCPKCPLYDNPQQCRQCPRNWIAQRFNFK